MGLNKVKIGGNMYQFLNDWPVPKNNTGYTWNVIKGKCLHECHYCFCKRFGPQKPIRFDESEFKTDLGKGNFIFIGSSCDMFEESISPYWINQIFAHCKKYPLNRYLFQSKNPQKMFTMRTSFPNNIVVGTTIETNRNYPQMGQAPSVTERAKFMGDLSAWFQTMITVEPIMNFDLKPMVDLIKQCNPTWVNIGADSQGQKLPEPSAKKVENLKRAISSHTNIKIKDNLKRIMK